MLSIFLELSSCRPLPAPEAHALLRIASDRGIHLDQGSLNPGRNSHGYVGVCERRPNPPGGPESHLRKTFCLL